jgi:dimethylargininase
LVPKSEEYAANCIFIKETVLLAEGHPKTRKLVEQKGFHVKEIEMSEFRKGDGALTCLSIIF